ncbi:MAG: tRNA modification GTPase TrmE [Deltaproteobacteria bacterium]|nr:tRNA modification GTPase TrmE [Deltaproteobacteria bacterium]
MSDHLHHSSGRASDETVAAIATPAGVGGIGIVKISGPSAWAIGQRLFQPARVPEKLCSHRLYHGHIVEPETGRPVDEVLTSFMRAPHTYTREDVVEINCHSGMAVLERILELVLRSGARLAEPGEFTRRAFLNGRIDLTQAEAVLDVIHSKTRRSLDLASEHLRGTLHLIITDLRTERLGAQVLGPVTALLARYEDGRILREGLAVIIAGKPNVGKSRLLNTLLRSDRALVTPVPGTTRDVIEEGFNLRGIPIRLMDTAGLRDADTLVEQLGMELTRDRLARADLVLFVLDRSASLTREDIQIHKELGDKPRIILLNKADLDRHPDFAEIVGRFPGETILEISALRGDGIEGLKDAVFQTIRSCRLDTETSVVAPNLRHKICLEGTQGAVIRAIELVESGASAELVAIELQEALRHLGEIIGMTTGEDVLDQIFSQFCIGK